MNTCLHYINRVISVAVFQAIGLVIYVAKLKNNFVVSSVSDLGVDFTLGWSYYLCWVSAVILVVGSIGFFVQAVLVHKKYKNPQMSA